MAVIHMYPLLAKDQYWAKPGASNSEFYQDRAACQYAAERDAGPFIPPRPNDLDDPAALEGVAREEHRSRIERFFGLCMNAKGWSLVEQ